MQFNWLLRTFIILSFFFHYGLMAQDSPKSEKEQDRLIASDQINELHDGILIICLPSNQKKIEALQKLSNSNKLEEKRKKRVRDQLASTLAETAFENQLIQAAFEQYYDFSKVLFMFDTAIVSITQKNTRAGVFLNNTLVVDPKLEIGKSSFFLLHFGRTDPAKTTRVEAMIIKDKQFEPLKAPFPASLKMNTLSYIADLALSPKNAFEKNINSRVKKLNKRLHRFYKKSQ